MQVPNRQKRPQSTYLIYSVLSILLISSACLCSWLQQDISCPTCRCSLSADIGIPPAVLPDNGDPMVQNELQDIVENNADDALGGLRNYFFYLDGQRIANWFPSLSIEVFHGRMGNNDQEINDMVTLPFFIACHCSVC